ncbi:MAG TPA: nuclear transport factor 2 family protein [Terriglobales bacterium]|nr:nuclear transport factor 2 family protein [Terriglobales bacterium]
MTLRVGNCMLAVLVLFGTLQAQNPDTMAVRKVITQFHQALETRNLKAIESLVATDLVVFENGHRNDGWADFRDNHLIPEMQEPASMSQWEIVRVAASDSMAWGYTKETISPKKGESSGANFLLWSVYIMEKRQNEWKIVVLDWSIRKLR